MHFTCKALNTSRSRVQFYSDSTTVLSWIRLCASRWKTFVANRVVKIQALSSTQWHQVGGNINPANLATCCVSPSTLIISVWLTGPKFLYDDSSSYTELSEPTLTDPVLKQRHCTLQSTTKNKLLLKDCILFHKYSSLSKLKCITALCLRFINNCRNSKNKVTGFLKI